MKKNINKPSLVVLLMIVEKINVAGSGHPTDVTNTLW